MRTEFERITRESCKGASTSLTTILTRLSPGLIRGYDVVLFPSLSEGFGLAVFEAMACGLAVVASRLPALQERLVEDDHIIFVSPGDIRAIATALNRLASDRGLLGRRKEAAFSARRSFLGAVWPSKRPRCTMMR